MTSGNPVRIQMLTDYVFTSGDRLILNQANDNIVITTANVTDGEYGFTPTSSVIQGRRTSDDKTRAVISRG
jgi:hypothetical protein